MKDISEALEITEVEHVVLEAELQAQCVRWWKNRGKPANPDKYWARKFSSISQRSVPDFLFAVYQRWDTPFVNSKIKFATEFKRPGTKAKLIPEHGVIVMSTKAQYEEQIAMRLAGWFVFECDNFDKFKATVLAYEAEW